MYAQDQQSYYSCDSWAVGGWFIGPAKIYAGIRQGPKSDFQQPENHAMHSAEELQMGNNDGKLTNVKW